MESKAKILGHAIHPILIVFPLGLLATAVIFDVIYLATANGTWAYVAFYLIAAGLIGGVVAALFGLAAKTLFAPPLPLKSLAPGCAAGCEARLCLAGGKRKKGWAMPLVRVLPEVPRLTASLLIKNSSSGVELSRNPHL